MDIPLTFKQLATLTMLKKLLSNWPAFLLLMLVCFVITNWMLRGISHSNQFSHTDSSWRAPSYYLDPIKDETTRELVLYGEELIAHTSKYLGPNGTVQQISNGMNCQNCHLDAGKRMGGNNYAAVAATYPKFRARSGGMESVYKRVSDCFERSLNGSAPDSNSREFQAIEAYIKWVGKDVAKNESPKGSGIKIPELLSRAADPVRGKKIYATTCQRCHSANGEGKMNPEKNGYEYPPLWGNHSYNTGAGLYRLSNFAGFVQSNMPFNEVTHNNQLTNEQAWDLAAYVNSQPRPVFTETHDWPDISKKPFDHPFGPYTDSFSEQQHKYGPYLPIIQAKKQ